MLPSLNGNAHQLPIARPHQAECVKQTKLEWSKGNLRILIVQPTAAGKTLTAGFLINDEVSAGGKVLVVTDRKKLTRQFAARMESDFGIQCGIEMSNESHGGEHVVSCTVQTICNRIKLGKFHDEEFGLLVFDEAHLALGAGFQSVANHFSKARIIGLTATPRSASQKDLLTFFNVKVEPANISDLITQGYLSPITFRSFPIKINITARSKNADFREDDLGHAIEPYLGACADEVVRLSVNRAGLSFLPLIDTSKKFTAMLKERGLKALHLDGTMKEAEINKAIRELEIGRVSMLCCSQLLSIGIDIPCVSLICSLRPTKSWVLWCQQIGRGTRLFDPIKHGPTGTTWPKKDNLLICDPLWLTDTMSLLQRPSTLFAEDEEEAEAIDKEIEKQKNDHEADDDFMADLMEARNEARRKREESLRQKLEALANRKAREVNAMELFSAIGHPELINYQPKSKWEADVCTPGQRRFLEASGINLESITSKGMATKVLENVIRRREQGLCTIKQAKYSESLGLKDAWNKSFDEVSAFITAAKNKQYNTIPDV